MTMHVVMVVAPCTCRSIMFITHERLGTNLESELLGLSLEFVVGYGICRVIDSVLGKVLPALKIEHSTISIFRAIAYTDLL